MFTSHVFQQHSQVVDDAGQRAPPRPTNACASPFSSASPNYRLPCGTTGALRYQLIAGLKRRTHAIAELFVGHDAIAIAIEHL